MPRAVLLAATLLAGPALAGCLAGEPPAGPPGASAPDGEPAARADGLALYLAANRSTMAPGEVVEVRYAVRNEGNATVWYNDVCGAVWNVTVLDPDGNPIQTGGERVRCGTWNWTPLRPGERLSYRSVGGDHADPFMWNGTRWDASGEEGDDVYEPVEAGNYTVRGSFLYALEKDGAARNITGAATVRIRGGGQAAPAPPDGGTEGDDGGANVTVNATGDRSGIQPGETVRVDFTAENVGDATVYRRQGCGFSWEVSVHEADGDEVQAHKPRPHCMGYGWVSMDPGETVSTSFGWNGTVWNGSAYRDADPGNYTVRGVLVWSSHEEGDEARQAAGNVTVRVSE